MMTTEEIIFLSISPNLFSSEKSKIIIYPLDVMF